MVTMILVNETPLRFFGSIGSNRLATCNLKAVHHIFCVNIGNIPALTRLLQAYVKRGAEEIISGGSLVSKIDSVLILASFYYIHD